MHNHAPEGYICPICQGVAGANDDSTMIRESDIVFRDTQVTVFVGSISVESNPHHLIVVPNGHFENIYDMPPEVHGYVHQVSQVAARALKEERGCSGITVTQNNEPDGGQHAFHLHVHVFPRFEGDNFHANVKNVRVTTPEEREPYATRLSFAFMELWKSMG